MRGWQWLLLRHGRSQLVQTGHAAGAAGEVDPIHTLTRCCRRWFLLEKLFFRVAERLGQSRSGEVHPEDAETCNEDPLTSAP